MGPPWPTVTVLASADVPPALLAEIRALMVDAFPDDFTEEDWANSLGGWHVAVTDDAGLVAHASVVPRELDVDGRTYRTGYLEAVATAATRRREGLGSLALQEAEMLLRRDFELGALSTGEHAFYEKLGWERWQGRTYVRDGDQVRHSTDDDDGVMVLRFGPSAAIDLTGSITCDARPGDDW